MNTENQPNHTLVRTIPTRDEVMEELNQVTLQYLSSSDPTEATSRRQRVLMGDAQGHME
ncbi:hypothetical protein YC2023_118663 [Brassica napus]